MAKNDNVKDVEAAIQNCLDEVRSIKGSRKSLNDDMQSALSSLESNHGIDREAIRLAVKIMEWDKSKRDGFLIAFGMVCKIAGAPLQPDLFDTGRGLEALAEMKQAEAEADAS